MKKLILLLILSLSFIGSTFADITGRTDDGRKVLLKSDGTWELIEESQSESSEMPWKLSNFKVRYKTYSEPNKNKVTYTALVKNQSNKRLKGGMCVRLMDKDNFEIESLSGGSLNFAPGKSEIDTEYFSTFLKPDLWAEVTKIKAYIGSYKCANTPSEAVSNVVIIAIKSH